MSALATEKTLFRYYWWTLGVRGLIAIIFGVLALLWSTTTSQFLMLFGIFALVDGLVALAAAFEERANASQWWISALGGLAGVVVGIVALVWTAVSLHYLIALWAIVLGLIAFAATFMGKRSLMQEWTLFIGGLLAIALGATLAIFSTLDFTTTVVLISIFAFVFGVLQFVRAFMFRRGSTTNVTA